VLPKVGVDPKPEIGRRLADDLFARIAGGRLEAIVDFLDRSRLEVRDDDGVGDASEGGAETLLYNAALGDVGLFGFWSMIVFLGVLTVGFAYEWKKGALEWE